ncbi:MAG: hypothetical protein ABSH50_18785 [Bryobacteraceae bacterium]|jgi:hypothetical protein
MLISTKQHEANLRSAQNSTGPVSAEAKEAVRFNALRHGLRARRVLLPKENPEEFHQLCAELEAEWQPRTCTERLLLEQMAVSQWILGRLAATETTAFSLTQADIEKQYAFLDRLSALRARHERSFANAMRDLQHLQRQPRQVAEPVQKPAPQFAAPTGVAPVPGAELPPAPALSPAQTNLNPPLRL